MDALLRHCTIILGLAVWAGACQPDAHTHPRAVDSRPQDVDPGPPQVALSGGETTVFDTTPNAFALSARNLDPDKKGAFFVGNSFFNDNWVQAPASTTARDGLGPVFNAQSCSSCHFKDGRGAPIDDRGNIAPALLFRLSVPGAPEGDSPRPEPTYGGQFNPRGVADVPGEGRAVVEYTEVHGRFDDGHRYTLRKPTYRFEKLNYGPMHPDTRVSPRVAPAMFGVGLLEAISERDVLALADPDDADGDGISGRANWVTNMREGKEALGRFGWKANQPTVEQQVAGAFLGDIGITSPMFDAQNCTDAQEACKQADEGANEEGFELDEHRLQRVAFYSRVLAVPGRRDWDDEMVKDGERLFRDANCAACHVSTRQTGVLEGVPSVSNQTIHPYTDLLLHDMGPGLADGRPDFRATGREWRTPPLWGIGLVETVNGHTNFLHDGRARNLTEAILWHGGEAADSRDAFKAMSAAERGALVAFLQSL